MGAPDLWRYCTAVEIRRLTGRSTTQGQREWCAEHGVPCHRRPRVDEAQVWITEDVSRRLAGFRDPVVGSFAPRAVAEPAPHPRAA